MLVLDPQNSGGANYAVEVWEDKPHQVAPMSGIALTVIGVVNESGGVPALGPRYQLQSIVRIACFSSECTTSRLPFRRPCESRLPIRGTV